MAVYARTEKGTALAVDIVGDQSAFGDARVSQVTPLCGWTFAYGINPAIVRSSVTGTGSVTASQSHAVVATGETASSTARMETVKTNRYIPGLGGLVRFTCIFDTPTASSTQKIGLFDDQDGWGFGYDGLSFGIFRMKAGVTNWTPKDSWNGADFKNFDPSKGIPFEISFQWLGYGAQYFKASTPDGQIITLHTIEYSNKFDAVSILNPNLPIACEVSNGADGGNIQLRTPSGMAGLEGYAYSEANSVLLSSDVADKTITAGTEYPVIGFFDPLTKSGVNNRLFVQALQFAFATDGTKNVAFRVWASETNPVNGTFADINTAITGIQVNKNATTFSTTGQVQIGVYNLGKEDSSSIDLTESKFYGYPGQYLTITARSVNASDVSAGVTYRQFL